MFAQVTKQTPEEITLRKQLSRSWCTVTYNSSPGVASLLYGTPVFVSDPVPKRSQCFPICNTDLNNIESYLEKAEKTKSTPVGGLADAIARAKRIKQEAIVPPKERAKQAEGVKKI